MSATQENPQMGSPQITRINADFPEGNRPRKGYKFLTRKVRAKSKTGVIGICYTEKRTRRNGGGPLRRYFRVGSKSFSLDSLGRELAWQRALGAHREFYARRERELIQNRISRKARQGAKVLEAVI